jgi:hypothetical protein
MNGTSIASLFETFHPEIENTLAPLAQEDTGKRSDRFQLRHVDD